MVQARKAAAFLEAVACLRMVACMHMAGCCFMSLASTPTQSISRSALLPGKDKEQKLGWSWQSEQVGFFVDHLILSAGGLMTTRIPALRF